MNNQTQPGTSLAEKQAIIDRALARSQQRRDIVANALSRSQGNADQDQAAAAARVRALARKRQHEERLNQLAMGEVATEGSTQTYEEDLNLAIAIAKARQRRQQQQATPGTVGGSSGAALDGALLGFGDEYLAGLSSVLGVQPDGQGGANWFDYSKPIGERYNTALSAIRREQSAFEEARPGLATAAGVTGAIVGPGKGGSAFINAGRGTGARIARGGLLGGGSAAAYGFGEGEDSAANRALAAAQSAPVGVLGGGVLTGAGQGLNRVIQTLSKRPGVREAVPSLQSLRDTANRLYAKSQELGGEIPAAGLKAMASRIQNKITDAGFHPKLHPRVAAVLSEFQGQSGSKSLADLELLRRIAKNASESTQPDERRIASQIIDEIDDTVAGIGAGSPVLQEARDTWARMRRMEIIETAIEKASLQDNFAAGLRTQFKALLRNSKRLRGFSEAERVAIRQVAKGTATVQALRGLGGLLSPTKLPGLAITGGTAFSGLGVAPALGVAGIGLGSRAAADALTRSAAIRARTLTGMSAQARGLLDGAIRKANPLSRAVPATGLLSSMGMAQ